ncbi:MAG: TetR/AcrR family transcriptional regulator [Actinomycetales bacterium]
MAPTTTYHHGDLREALATEAELAVRARGADALSLRAVATSVGVSPSAAYHHFPDKAALLLEVGQRAETEFDRRMQQAVQDHPGESEAAVLARIDALASAYVSFALDEPHLFRHLFGPLCVMAMRGEAQAGEAAADKLAAAAAGDTSAYAANSLAFRLLCEALDEAEERHLLRRGARPGLDLVAWSLVHGFASLAVDGLLPVEASAQLLDTLRRLTLSDAVLRRLDNGSR